MAYGDSWRGREGADQGYGGSTPAERARRDDIGRAYERRSYSPADREPGQPRGGHTEWGMGAPGGYGHSDPRVHRGSYGGYRGVGNRGDYSFDSGSGDAYDFFGDQGNRVPSGFGGVTGPYAADFGSGYERSATRGIRRAGDVGRGGRVGMSGNFRGEQGGRFEGDWYDGADYGGRTFTGAPPGGRQWPSPDERRPPHRESGIGTRDSGEDRATGAPSRAGARSNVGRGPRGYRRSDRRIEEDINEALTAHPAIDASDVEVHAAGGVVRLSGHVAAPQMRWLAEDVAQNVAGVRSVENEIRLGR